MEKVENNRADVLLQAQQKANKLFLAIESKG